MQVIKIYTVFLREDFYIILKEYTKFFTSLEDAYAYEDELMNIGWKRPTFTYLETKFAIKDDEKYYLLDSMSHDVIYESHLDAISQ